MNTTTVSPRPTDARIPQSGTTLRAAHKRTGSEANALHALLVLALLLGLVGAAHAAGPDLTVSSNRYTVNRTYTYNLGPTGLRGWIYTEYGTYNSETSTGFSPWQILVTSVGTGTPAAAAGLQVDDVIVGAQAGGGAVSLFANNARMALGLAIGGAEATNGVLRLLVNRYGVGTNQTYTLQLKLTNLAYSATAPYNCPKSARLLADAATVISNMSFSYGEPGNAVLGLGKLAAGITNAALMTYARSASVCPATDSLQPRTYYDSWEWGYKSIFLAEYFLFTGDTSVTNGIREWSSSLGEAMSLYGTMGHHFTENRHDGTPGSTWGYGPMIACSIPPGVSLVLAKKCGISHPEIDPAIDRLGKFLNYYVDKGSLPYGEHEPEEGSEQANNGKPGNSAIFFGLQGNMPTQTEYFARVNMAQYLGMECWHCGGDPNYIWGWIAAHLAGTNALASRFAQMQWYVDLGRRYDGSFMGDWYDQGGSGATTVNYWDAPTTPWGLQPSPLYVLLFSSPSRRIYLTGRNPNPTNVLSAAAVSNAIWAGRIATTRSGYTTNDLLGFFGEYDPKVRWTAAQEVATRPGSNTLVRTLLTMITNDNPRVRGAACQALGTIKSPSAITALVARLYDQDMMVRKKAGSALQIFDAAATVAPHLTNIMTAFITNGSLDQYSIDWADPLRMANNYLSGLLFAQRPSDTLGAPSNLFYDAVKVGLAQPDGVGRGNLSSFMLGYMTWTHVQTLAPNIVLSAMDPPPGDRMFGYDVPIYAIKTLAKYRVEEGIPLAVRIADKYLLYNGLGQEICGQALNVLSNSYRGSAKDALPALYTMQSWEPGNPDLAGAIYSINNLAGPTLTNFKRISVVSATPTSFTLPASNVTLNCSVTDTDKGIPSYVWSKTQGVGSVTFSVNGSTAASNSTATFSTPGTYVIRMACVDRSILDTSTWQWGYAPVGSQTYTNLIGAVYTNFTIKVYAPPFVNITNANALVTDASQMLIGGTNNTQVVGGMRVVSMTGSTTNYTGTIAAATPWTIMVINLVGNMTNFVTVSGTNGMGVVTNDTIEIYRPPVPLVQITNTPANMIILPASSNTWRISGTNNAWVVGGMTLTNMGVSSVRFTATPAWSTNTFVQTGFNTITVSGTNYNGAAASSTYTVCVGTPPNLRITNFVSGSLVVVPSAQDTQYIAGTNNMIVGGMIWSNSMGGGARFTAANPWNITASLSNDAYNVIRIWGTNTANTIFADTVTVFRGGTPYVNITNDNFTVPFFPVSRADIVVTNRAVVGSMSLVSVAGDVTNYTETIAAASPLTVTVSNLLSGATNYVTVAGTNVVGMMTNDSIEIYRQPEPPPGAITNYALTGSGTAGTLATEGGYNDGYRFLTGSNNLTATWLGFYDAPSNDVTGTVGDGLASSPTVLLWRESDQVLLTSAQILSGTNDMLIGAFRGHAISNVVLVSNTAYRITIYNFWPDRYRDGNDLSGWQTNEIYITGGCYGGGNSYPNAGWGVIIGANFGYEQQIPSVAQMLSFGSGATINEAAKTIDWIVPYGTDVTNLAPTYTVSSGTGSPASGSTNDFTNPAVYTVNDWDLFIANAYTVTVTVTPPSSTNDMLTFGIPDNPGVISGTVIYLSVPYGTSITNMAPTYTISPLATCDRASGSTNNCSDPVVYSVFAQDLSEKDYVVYVTVRPQTFWPVTNGVVVWLSGDTIDTTDTNQLRTAGSDLYVQRWYDQSGNGRNAIHTNDLSQPLYLADNLNGYPVVQWNNAGENMVGASTATIKTIFFVIKTDNPAGWQLMFEANGGNQAIYGGGTDWVDGYNDAHFEYPNNAATRINGAATHYHGGEWHILREVSPNYPSFTYALGPNWGGRIAEIVFYNRMLDSDEIATVERYLSNKYWVARARIDITNITGMISVTNTTQEIAGTNNEYTVGMWWTNSQSGGAAIDPVPGSWSFTATLQPGNNIITVYGTNVVGNVESSCVTVNYAVTPFVNITNDDFNVAMATSAAAFGGTNNTGPIGSMKITSVTGATTNYTATFPATMSWSAVVSNLVAGATNYVTVTGTNGVNEATADTIQIYRRPIVCVDITNISGLIEAASTTQTIAGTNNVRVVGDMWWANSIGSNGVLDPAPGGWSFTTELYPGSNIFTVGGTNEAGDVATDTVNVHVTPHWPITNGITVWLAGDTINPSDTNQVVVVNGTNYVRRWPDLSGKGQDATQTASLSRTSVLAQYVPNDLNGYPTVKWIDTDGPAEGEHMRGPSNTTFKTLFFVVVQDGTGPWHYMFTDLAGGYDINTFWYGWNGGSGFPAANWIWVNGANTTTHNAQWHIMRAISGSPVSFTYRFDSFNWTGRIAEWIAYDRELDVEEAWAVESYLSNKYWVATLKVDITNLPSGVITVTNATQYVAGTNNFRIVGGLTWTNMLTGTNGAFSAAPGVWNFVSSLSPGYNTIIVRGTNFEGLVCADTVVVSRAIAPYVDITNGTAMTIPMGVTQVTIGGTNNAGCVGGIKFVCRAGSVTNFTASVPVATSWSIAVTNLIPGMTNFVTVTATNALLATTNDTIQIFRRSVAFVDITNLVGTIYTTNAVQKIAGTNNAVVVGGMIWSNSMGGGAKFAPSTTTGWTFNVTLSNAPNIITVWGTNDAGDMASDTVTVMPPNPSNDILSCSFGPWGIATINGTNITIDIVPTVPLTNLAPTFVISDYATMNPVSGTTNDFTTPKFYTVTSQSGSNKQYKVTVNTWQYKGSLYTLTTPESANLPGAALETNFPLLLRLNQYNFDFSQAQPDGRDIRFSTPAGLLLPYQIEEWSNSTASIWIRMPYVAGTQHQEFVMCWGKTNVASLSSGSSVFNAANGFAAVMHLDAALKDEIGALAPTNAGATVADGMIGRGITMAAGAGVNCGTHITNFPSGSQPFSTMFWFKSPLSSADMLGWGWQQGQSKVVYQLASPPHINIDAWFGGAGVGGTATVSPSQWHHVAHTFTNNATYLYVDGVLDTSTGGGGMTISNVAQMYLGGWWGAYNYEGEMDEVQVSKVNRSASYIKMQYENQKLLQKLVGLVVQTGTAFTTVPTSITMNENETTNLVSQAGGARKLYWVYRQAGVDTLLAVDRFTFPFSAGRVSGNQSFSIQFRGVYASQVKTNDVPVTVIDTIPDPAFTLIASTNLWDGRSVMTVTTNISNWAALLASGYTNLTYSWSVDGVAATKIVTPGLLTLTLAQGSGPMTVYLVLDNGGAKITNSVVIQVQEPTNEAWIVRAPDANEKPTNMQFYARDNSGYGTVYYNGTIGGSPSSVFITIYTNNGVADVVYTNISQAAAGGTYAFTAKIKAGLVQYKLQFRSVVGGVTNLLNTVDDLVCGDAYIVDGQSNAVTSDIQPGDRSSNKWIRTYGRSGLGWSYACRSSGANFDYNFFPEQIGWWEYEIASNLVARFQVPICMINGAIGGTRIDHHMPGVVNPINNDTIFDTLSNRVALAKLTHGIRAFLWHQGESDSGNDGPDGDANYKFYQRYFLDMSIAWKQACPNIRNYFIYQVYPYPCGMGPYGDQIREVQRNLPKLYSPRMRVMSTVGLPGYNGCHYFTNGYANMGYVMLPLVEQDIYGATPGATNTAPNLKTVSFTSASQNQLALDFGQTMIWNSSATNMFFLDNVGGKVTSGSVTGSVMYLQLSGYTTNATITYLDDQVWVQSQTNKLLYGANGIAALTFADVPISPSTPPPFVDITNANFSVGMYVTNTLIGGTNNATAIGFMRLTSVTGGTTNYTALIAATTPWTAIVSNLVDGATNVVTMTATNNLGAAASDTVLIFRAQLPKPGDVQSFAVGRGAEYGQMQLSWSNGSITVLACTNRLYSTNAADWFVLSSGVATPWTHTDASNFPSVYYRIVSGSYTSQYAVGKYDINIAPGSIAWLSFPFGVQAGCDIVAEWFGQQLEARYNSSYDFPSLQRQSSPGGTIEYSDYYIADLGNGATNWFPTNTVVANAGYVLFLPQTHGGVKVTGIGMVQTNNVTMLLPYNSIPWVGLAYDVVMDMRQSGLTNMLQPPRLYSTFNYDFVDSQQTPGGPIWYAEYYRDNWGAGSINFFPSATGADKLEPGKGYLLFFSTSRAGTGTWTCVKPY